MKPDVSIIVVTYECHDVVEDCLDAVFGQSTTLELEVIVLDNGSGDGTAAMVGAAFPRVELIALDENVGFGRGVNVAAARAEGEFLLLLNPDAVLHKGALEALVGFARAHPTHGIYGGRAFWPDGSIQPGSCWGRPTPWSLACFGTLVSTAFPRSRVFDPESLGGWQRDSVREVDVVTGCMLLIQRSLWAELNGFDEVFFMYGEDVDLSLRAHERGFRPVITPDAVITHAVGVSSAKRSDKFVLVFQGKVTLVKKHWPWWSRWFGIAMLWLGVALRALLSRRSSPDRQPSSWRGVWQERRRWLAGYT